MAFPLSLENKLFPELTRSQKAAIRRGRFRALRRTPFFNGFFILAQVPIL
jgi:hypothetical protein